MPRKNIHITKETEAQLKEIEKYNGAKHSAIIRVGVDDLHKKIFGENKKLIKEK